MGLISTSTWYIEKLTFKRHKLNRTSLHASSKSYRTVINKALKLMIVIVIVIVIKRLKDLRISVLIINIIFEGGLT